MKFPAFCSVIGIANLWNLDKMQERNSNLCLVDVLQGRESFYDRFGVILYYDTNLDRNVFETMTDHYQNKDDKFLELKRYYIASARKIYREIIQALLAKDVRELLIDTAEELARRLLGMIYKITVSPRIFDYLYRISVGFTALKLRREVTIREVEEARDYLMRTTRFREDVIKLFRAHDYEYEKAKELLLSLCEEKKTYITSQELFEEIRESFKNDPKTFELLYGDTHDTSRNWKWRRIINQLKRDRQIVHGYGQGKQLLLWHLSLIHI